VGTRGSGINPRFPRLRGNVFSTLCVASVPSDDAERRRAVSHAERGNEGSGRGASMLISSRLSLSSRRRASAGPRREALRILKDSVRVSKAYAQQIDNTDRTEIVIDVQFQAQALSDSGPAGDDQTRSPSPRAARKCIENRWSRSAPAADDHAGNGRQRRWIGEPAAHDQMEGAVGGAALRSIVCPPSPTPAHPLRSSRAASGTRYPCNVRRRSRRIARRWPASSDRQARRRQPLTSTPSHRSLSSWPRSQRQQGRRC